MVAKGVLARCVRVVMARSYGGNVCQECDGTDVWCNGVPGA